jgi:ketosteroid isomerase-like protein
MYRRIVARKTRAVWNAVAAGDPGAPAALADDDVHVEFVGTTPLSGAFTGREAFGSWFRSVFDRFPDIAFEVLDVAVDGWPWKTRVAVRLRVSATLADGSVYENFACQWLTLRWGRMTDDWVLEDTMALQHACDVQGASQMNAV